MWTFPPLPRIHNYNGSIGLHNSLGTDCSLKNVQYWSRQDGATTKAASRAALSSKAGTSVLGLAQRFEQLSIVLPSLSAMMKSAWKPTLATHLPS